MPYIRHLRSWRGNMSREELAERSGVSVATIARLEKPNETGFATYATANKLASALDISREQLLIEARFG
jgi:transcriptional regulator with XRE-family HTH domain